MSEEKNQNAINLPATDEDQEITAAFINVDELEGIDSPLDTATKKRNPFIKDPVAYAQYRNRGSKNRLF